MSIEPAATGTFPSETLSWEQLDTALLVVVVDQDGTVHAFTDESTPITAHAAHLRTLAAQMDATA